MPEHHLLVHLDPGSPRALDALHRKHGTFEGELMRLLDGSRLVAVTFADEDRALAALPEFNEASGVIVAQPDFRQRPCLSANDTFYASQWDFPAAHIPTGWDLSVGEKLVKVGDIDTDLDLTHPDMQASLYKWQDFGGSGFGGNSMHGTGTASIIAASTNNAIGVAGVNWRCALYFAKASDNNNQGSFFDSYIIAAINWFIQEGVTCYNMSFGGAGNDPAMEAAIANSAKYGLVPCAAAGNDNSTEFFTPADWPEVLCIGACNRSLGRLVPGNDPNAPTWGSNYGPQQFCLAPGAELYTCWFSSGTHNYISSFNGTSGATPHVTGIVALMMAVNATAPISEVKNAIAQTCLQTVGTQGTWNQQTGWGVIQAREAMLRISGRG